MSSTFQIYYVPYDTQRPEYTQDLQITFQPYTSFPPWHVSQQQQIARNIDFIQDNFLTQGNAPANMSITGLTMMSGITGIDDGYGYIPVAFPFTFFGINYSNSTSNGPGVYWNTNNVLGFGTGTNTITWAATTGQGILLGNLDRRTNSMYYSGTQTIGATSYINSVLLAQNIYSDNIQSSIAIQLRLARSPSYQYVELRMSTVGGTNGAWNITNGIAFQNTFGSFLWAKGSSIVLQSDLAGSNWTFYNNYYLNF